MLVTAGIVIAVIVIVIVVIAVALPGRNPLFPA